MNNIFKTVFIIFSIAFLFYIFLPNPSFPEPPPGALQSNEPADTETPLRRAYYTNYSREEVLIHYQNQLAKSSFYQVPLPAYRLNYPPEEAQTIIRDQTRSTFLEEVVHPFRESFFINGFEPKEAKDVILVQDRKWRQKIIIRYVPSNLFARWIIAGVTIAFIYWISREYLYTFKGIRQR